MKLFSGTRLYSVVILALLALQLCSSTLLAGTMFYYLMGNYFTRTIFPSAVGSLFRTMVNSQSSGNADMKTVNHYIINPDGSKSVLPVIHAEKEPSTLESMVKLAKAIGLDQRVNSYVKEAFTELDCLEDDCKKKKKKKNKKTKKEEKQQESVQPKSEKPKSDKSKSDKPKSDEDDDSEEDDFSKPTLTASEEMAGYTIFGEDEDDILTQADEELTDEDPMNFFFIMQDRKRRAEQEKFAAENPFFRNEPPPKNTPGSRVPDLNRPDFRPNSAPPPQRGSRNPDFNRPDFHPDSSPPHGPRNPDFNHPDFRPDAPPSRGPRNPNFNGLESFHEQQPPFPVPRRGVLPIFIRYKVKPNQPGSVPNMPPMHSPEPNNNFLFRRRTGQQQQQQQPQTERPLSLFNALNQVAANVLTKQILLPVPHP